MRDMVLKEKLGGLLLSSEERIYTISSRGARGLAASGVSLFWNGLC